MERVIICKQLYRCFFNNGGLIAKMLYGLRFLATVPQVATVKRLKHLTQLFVTFMAEPINDVTKTRWQHIY